MELSHRGNTSQGSHTAASASDLDRKSMINAPRVYTWGHIESQRSVVSSAPWALENWNKPAPLPEPQDAQPLVYPKRLVSVQDLSVVAVGAQTLGAYTAISHTWGSRTLEGDTTAGAAYRVSPEHSQKLKEIRAAVELLGDKYFWIDTMCIDQNNTAEKSEEVKKMGHYYRNASRCLVHLDDLIASEMLLKAYPFFKRYIEEIPSGIDSMTHIIFGMSDDRIFMSAMFLINSIVDSLWGTRVWMIQEALLNPILDFMIPGMPEVISSRMIENALYFKTISGVLSTSGVLNTIKKEDLPPGFHGNLHMPLGEQIVNDGKSNIAQVILTRTKGISDLSTVLDLVGVRDCTLEVDRVYGVLGLLPYGGNVNVDYSASLKDATKELFESAIKHGDTSGMYFTGKSHGMIPDLKGSSPSMAARFTFPHERAGPRTQMVVEHVGIVREFITLRENVSSCSDDDKLRLTLKALYSVIDLMGEGKLKAEEAAYVTCLSLPTDRSKVWVLARPKGAFDSLEEQQAIRGMSIMYGESRILLARVTSEGKADKWVGASSDEDISKCHIVCMGITGWEDRMGMIVRPMNASTVRRAGASGMVPKDVYPIMTIQVTDSNE